MSNACFPFVHYLGDIPEYFSLVETFFRENVLILSTNCVSSKVSVDVVLSSWGKKFGVRKISKEQFFLAVEYLKSSGKIAGEFRYDDENFYGVELLVFKKFKPVKKNEKCNRCGLYQEVNKDGHCVYCKVVKKKRKEHVVRDFLSERGWKFFSADRVVENGECGKERPDMLFDFGEFFVCVEVDEFQHRNYECEFPRVLNIFHAVGMSRMVLVRMNPDSFVDRYYRKNKLDLSTRCEMLDGLLRNLECKKFKVENTIEEYKLFFDYDPMKQWIDDCCSFGVLVKGEILDVLKKK